MTHETSLAVWDVSSPVVVGRSFTVKVGAKCAAGCALTGQPVVVRDAAGTVVGEGILGDTPWPGTGALYGTELTLTAPAGEGFYSWSASFAGNGATVPHRDASAAFSFRNAAPPEHRVTVTVVSGETKAPLRNVQVHLGVHRATTDGRGRATIEVRTGRYDLDLWKVGYEAHARAMLVTGSVRIQVEVSPASEADPDDDQVWM